MKQSGEEQSMPGRARRVLEGILLALGAPVGWLLYRVLFEGAVFPDDILASLDLYLYMTIGTTLFFALFAVRLGTFERRLHRSNRDLANLALTDPLTGLCNSRAFRTRLDQAWERAQRDGSPLSLIILDLDHFKQVNDQHGHPVGDRVLVETGRRIGEAVRTQDSAARVGGEEFAILLPDTEPEEAVSIADRVRRAMEVPLPDTPGDLTVTISAGVALASPDAESTHGFYARADAALYEAKEAGRNQVVMSRTAPEMPESREARPAGAR